jgi:predicted CopG family antitoxin
MKKTLKIEEDIHYELIKIKGEMKLKTISDVIRFLLITFKGGK